MVLHHSRKHLLQAAEKAILVRLRIEAKEQEEIRTIIYDESVLKLYNLPIFYFPKFFHPIYS